MNSNIESLIHDYTTLLIFSFLLYIYINNRYQLGEYVDIYHGSPAITTVELVLSCPRPMPERSDR